MTAEEAEAVAGEIMAGFPYDEWRNLPVGQMAWDIERKFEHNIATKTGCDPYFARQLCIRFIAKRSKEKAGD